MKKTLLLTLLTLSAAVAQASTLDQSESKLPLSVAERAAWKEALIEEQEIACGECNGKSDKEPKASCGYNGYAVYTSHPGVIYFPIDVTTSGDQVTLFDGSVWQIRSWDRDQTRGWLSTDEIVIMPNTNFFSFYDYKLLNRMTGVAVEANLYLSPILGSIFTRQIIGFNHDYNYIYLSDGTVWSTSPSDYYLYKQWYVGDIVLIGANVLGDSNIRPNILVNPRHHSYIRTNCIQ